MLFNWQLRGCMRNFRGFGCSFLKMCVWMRKKRRKKKKKVLGWVILVLGKCMKKR